MMGNESRYDKRGVSASKEEVHKAIKNMDKGLYPLAFCKVLPDMVGGEDDYCNIMHADTAGTKTSLAYIYHQETGDISVWEGIVQDSIVMNVDDMACVGAVDKILLSSTIGRNKHLISGEVISKIINGATRFVEQMAEYGITILQAGGETADVGDIVRTIDVGFTTFARLKRSDLIVNDIKGGNVIVGIASYGQSTYETEYNGGMGSNGLTSARHDVFAKTYAEKYPESYDPNTDKDVIYVGSKSLTDEIEVPGYGKITAGKLVLSPTRTYLPLIKKIVDQQLAVDGMIHCTGGAQTKVIKFVKNKKVIKDNLLPIPPLFKMIEEESGTPRKEMYQVFNMGHRLEVYCDEETAVEVIKISKSFNIDAQVIGRVEDNDQNEVEITDELGTYTYR